MKGKMRTLYGIYKKHGRDAFLDAAKDYSAHVRDTVEDTLAEMESRWYDGGHTMTEAEKMVDDYISVRAASSTPSILFSILQSARVCRRSMTHGSISLPPRNREN